MRVAANANSISRWGSTRLSLALFTFLQALLELSRLQQVAELETYTSQTLHHATTKIFPSSSHQLSARLPNCISCKWGSCYVSSKQHVWIASSMWDLPIRQRSLFPFPPSLSSKRSKTNLHFSSPLAREGGKVSLISTPTKSYGQRGSIKIRLRVSDAGLRK